MKITLHTSESRGYANHGWLDTHHTFSFAGYYDPERVHFGALRVLNDDIVSGGAGFATHPHDNMEIVSIPLAGDLAHQDSEGNGSIIRHGDVQIMSAGTGILHSEKNPNPSQKVNFLQIWVFPKKRNIQPRYGQQTFPVEGRQNQWQTIVSPEEGSGLWINQDAWFSLARLEAGRELNYELHLPSNGVYCFMIEGKSEIAGQTLKRRDGIGIEDAKEVTIAAREASEILLIEVPMR